VHDALFSAYDNEPSWGIAHRIIYPHLTTTAISSQVPTIVVQTEQLTAKWAKSGMKTRFDVTDGLRRLNLQCVIKCLFSQDYSYLEGPEPSMIVAMDGATLEAIKRPTRPKLVNWLVYQRRFTQDTKAMRGFAAEVVKKRQNDPQQKGIEGDMLHVLLNGKDPETGKGLTDSEIIDEVVTLLIGVTTAPNFVAFALYYLTKNPDVIKKAQSEIDQVLPKGEQFTHEHLQKLQYVEAILREVMRLSAPAPGFNIEPLPSTVDPVQLGGGKYTVPKNQVMISILSAVNRDPTVFDNPEEFLPERMLGEKYDQLPSGVKKGFGNGKRMCIGNKYAWQWSMVTLTTILRELDLNAADANYQLRMDGAFNVKPVGFFAVGAVKG
jgi:cytochrome P450